MKQPYIIIILCLLCTTAFGQNRRHIVRIKADTVQMSNPKGTNELILENRTSQIDGYLSNKGQGVTEFRRLKLKQIGMDSLAILDHDTVPLPTFQKLYILPDIQCQDWNGAPVVVHKNPFRVYLNLATPATLVNGKQLRISDVSGQGWGDYVTIWSSGPWLLHEGIMKEAMDLSPGTTLCLVYNAALEAFVVTMQDGPINSTTNPCPDFR
jgi:hypothetical protein